MNTPSELPSSGCVYQTWPAGDTRGAIVSAGRAVMVFLTTCPLSGNQGVGLFRNVLGCHGCLCSSGVSLWSAACTLQDPSSRGTVRAREYRGTGVMLAVYTEIGRHRQIIPRYPPSPRQSFSLSKSPRTSAFRIRLRLCLGHVPVTPVAPSHLRDSLPPPGPRFSPACVTRHGGQPLACRFP